MALFKCICTVFGNIFFEKIVMTLFKSICTVFGDVFFEDDCYGIGWVLTCEVVACRGGEVLVAVAAGDHLQVVHLYKTLSFSTSYRQLLLLTKKYKPSMMFTLFFEKSEFYQNAPLSARTDARHSAESSSTISASLLRGKRLSKSSVCWRGRPWRWRGEARRDWRAGHQVGRGACQDAVRRRRRAGHLHRRQEPDMACVTVRVACSAPTSAF